MTDYWVTGKAEDEVRYGKNVADASKEAGVSHLIFSSLLNVTELSGGKLRHVTHFDSKADVEKYIRSVGIPCTFVMPAAYMTNYQQQLRKGDDGVWTLAYPIPQDESIIPLISPADDLGLFVKPALRDPAKFNGKRILAAAGYYTPRQLLADFEEVTGHKTQFFPINGDMFKSFLPPHMAEELYENHLLMHEPGYYGGASLDESLAALGGEKPTSWKDFVKTQKDWME